MIRDYDIEQMKKHTCCPNCDRHIVNFIDNHTDLTHSCVIELRDSLIAHVKKQNKVLHENVTISINRKLKALKPTVKKKGKKHDSKKESS